MAKPRSLRPPHGCKLATAGMTCGPEYRSCRWRALHRRVPPQTRPRRRDHSQDPASCAPGPRVACQGGPKEAAVFLVVGLINVRCATGHGAVVDLRKESASPMGGKPAGRRRLLKDRVRKSARVGALHHHKDDRHIRAKVIQPASELTRRPALIIPQVKRGVVRIRRAATLAAPGTASPAAATRGGRPPCPVA